MEYKRPCIEVSSHFVQQHAVESTDALLNIVTSDEIWLDYFDPETK
jgi:hypothetical protein